MNVQNAAQYHFMLELIKDLDIINILIHKANVFLLGFAKITMTNMLNNGCGFALKPVLLTCLLTLLHGHHIAKSIVVACTLLRVNVSKIYLKKLIALHQKFVFLASSLAKYVQDHRKANAQFAMKIIISQEHLVQQHAIHHNIWMTIIGMVEYVR